MVIPARSEGAARFPRSRLPFVLLPNQVIEPYVKALGPPLDSALVALLLFLLRLVHVQSHCNITNTFLAYLLEGQKIN